MNQSSKLRESDCFIGDIPERVRFIHGFKLSTIVSLESGRPATCSVRGRSSSA